jgi:hypothetical protein
MAKKTSIETLEFEIAPGRVAEVEAVVERCGGRRIAPEEYLAAEDPHADGRLSVRVVLALRQDGTHGAVLFSPRPGWVQATMDAIVRATTEAGTVH